MQSVKDRLQSCESALKDRGVKDVKFFFGSYEKPLSDLASDAADALECVVKGKLEELPEVKYS